MATEQEELRLTVNLADNASAGLQKLNEEIKQLGSGASQQHVEKFKRETTELTTKIKAMSGEVGEAFKGLGMLRGGLAAGGAGLALFGYELAKQIGALGQYADKLRNVAQLGKTIGVDPGVIKSISDQLKIFGVSGEQAQASIAKFAESMAALQREPSMRAGILRDTAREGVGAMNELIDRLNRTKDIEDKLNIVREGAENVRRNALKRGESEERAADEARKFGQKFGYDAELAYAGALKKRSEDEKKADEARTANAKKYSEELANVYSKWEDIKNLMNDSQMGENSTFFLALKAANATLQGIVDAIKWLHAPPPPLTPEQQQQKDQFDKGRLQDENRRRELLGLPPRTEQELKKSTDENTTALKKLTSLIDGGTNTGGLGMSGPGGGIINAAYHPGGGGPFGPRGGGGGGGFRSGGGYQVLPNGQTAGPGTGAGAGTAPPSGAGRADGGGVPSTKGPMVLGKGDDPRGMEAYIREAAAREGVDPDTAVRVAKSEGLRDFLGDKRKSGGAFQLYTGGGLGNEFQKETGLDPLDPKNEKATIDYALKKVKQTGWGPWHGAKAVGVGPREGLPGGTPPRAPPNGQTAGAGSGAGAGDTPAGGTAAGGDLPPRVQAVGGEDPAAFITHHTGGRGSVAGVQNTLRQRGLGVQYVMDREGNIVQTGGPGASHMRSGWGEKGLGLSNRNVVGMEIIAKDDKDVTPAQAAAYARFMALRYPNTPIYGHGEVNPGHKEADEGLTAKRAAMADRERQQINRSQAAETRVTGTGKLTVDVNAPKGTNVGAEGGGLFKNVEINRQTQMSEAPRGPKGGYATEQFLQ